MQMSEKQHDNIVIDFADDDSNENTGRHNPSFHLEFTSFSEKNEMMMISKRCKKTNEPSQQILPTMQIIAQGILEYDIHICTHINLKCLQSLFTKI